VVKIKLSIGDVLLLKLKNTSFFFNFSIHGLNIIIAKRRV